MTALWSPAELIAALGAVPSAPLSAAVAGVSIDSRAERRARDGAERRDQFGWAPKRGPRASLSAARASSASENGSVLAPTI